MLHQSPRTEIVLVSLEPTAAQQLLEDEGFRVLAVDDCTGALQVLRGHPFDAVVVAVDCPHRPEFLHKLREVDGALQVLVLTEADRIPDSLRAADMRVDLLEKSIPREDLRMVIGKGAQLTRLRRENARLRAQLQSLRSGDDGLAKPAAPTRLAQPNCAGEVAIGADVDLATISRAHVLSVLAQHDGNKARAARALGINRRSLYRLLEKFAPRDA